MNRLSLLPALAASLVLSALWFGPVAGAEAAAPAVAPETPAVSTAIIIVGAAGAGEEELGKSFVAWSEYWERACAQAGVKTFVIGKETNAAVADQARFKAILESEAKESDNQLWIVLLGHGTFDGRDAKFNLRGPDLTAEEFGKLLDPFNRPIAFIDCSSASSPFINKLSKPGRVIISATRSGSEINYARFGQYLSQAIASPAADLDKDGQTSLLEAFLTGAQNVVNFYKDEGRLATEHPLIEDTGDAMGTPPEWFRGARAVKKAASGASTDGARAHQYHLVLSARERALTPTARRERDQLELAIVQLRDEKELMSEEEYYSALEPLALELARFYQRNEPAPK